MPILSTFGVVLQLRLCVCYSGYNRGFGYVIFKEQYCTTKLIDSLNGLKVRFNHKIYAKLSYKRRELVIKNIYKCISNESISRIIKSLTLPINMQFFENNSYKNVLLTYATHREAALSRRILYTEMTRFGPFTSIYWAQPR